MLLYKSNTSFSNDTPIAHNPAGVEPNSGRMPKLSAEWLEFGYTGIRVVHAVYTYAKQKRVKVGHQPKEDTVTTSHATVHTEDTAAQC